MPGSFSDRCAGQWSWTPAEMLGLSAAATRPTRRPKDLVRALAWFLSCDPFTSLDLDDVAQLQEGALPVSRVGKPIVNDVRWNRFAYWAPALGFAPEPLLDNDRPRQPMVPDCTVAVRQTVQSAWVKDQRVEASEATERIIAELPVLPGGSYSQSLGLLGRPRTCHLRSPSPCLRDDQGGSRWSIAPTPRAISFLTDPDAAAGTRRVSDISITGSPDD